MSFSGKYEAVIGLEVHAQLLTNSKLFCGDDASYGGKPNSHVSPVSLAHPGTLPMMNKKAIEHAIRLGLALQCDIVRDNYFARKNYFYPDLPKGYQVSQHTTPICKNGYVVINMNGEEKQVVLNRIHLEEDAGKSIHDADDEFTSIDLNRAGVALLEIVTEPVMHSSEEAFAYVTELRKIVRYLDVCDGNMEEGSLRCDANVSIRIAGETSLGTKVEIKNLNSIRNVKRAIDFEIDRLIALAENNEQILQQTRSYDADKNVTFSMRDKEQANDYRYFPEPDLAPFHITLEMLNDLQQSMPALPAEMEKKFSVEYGLSESEAKILSEEKEFALYYQSLAENTEQYKAAANWMLGPVKSYLNENNLTIEKFPLDPSRLAPLLALVAGEKVSFGMASTKLLPEMIANPARSPLEIAKTLNILQEKDDTTLGSWVDEVLARMPDKIADYKKGKKNLIGLFAGEVKKISKGKADMKAVHHLLTEKLNQ